MCVSSRAGSAISSVRVVNRLTGSAPRRSAPNHAWRHTFKRRAARAGIEAGIRDAICGHSPRAVADQYETPTVVDMAEALKKFPRYDIVSTKQEGKTKE